MEAQDIINALIGILGIMFGYILNSVKQSVNELTTKVQSVEVLVAGNYVPRAEYIAMAERLYSKLDQIEKKLDSKADK